MSKRFVSPKSGFKLGARRSQLISSFDPKFHHFSVVFDTVQTALKTRFFTTLAEVLPQERKVFIFPIFFFWNDANSLDLIPE